MLITLLLAAILAGCLMYAVCVTFKWLKNKIKERLKAKKAKKVVVTELKKLIDECPNTMKLDELMDEGYSHVLATVHDNGEVSDVDIIKDKNETIDSEVESLINRTGQGMVVIER